MSSVRARITTANYLGASRILLWTPLATTFVLLENWSAAVVAILLSGLSDILDGYIARKEGTVSNFGVFLDLTADKVFVSSMFICFAYQGSAPLWAVMTIVLREFLVTGVRCFAAAENVVIPAARIGGFKIIATFAAIVAIVLHLEIARYLLILAVGLTIVSGLYYVYRARHLLGKDLRYSSTEEAQTGAR